MSLFTITAAVHRASVGELIINAENDMYNMDIVNIATLYRYICNSMWIISYYVYVYKAKCVNSPSPLSILCIFLRYL